MSLHHQIRQYLLNQAQIHGWLAHAKIPSERELQAEFNASRITIRDGLTKLESQGFIYRVNRKGWFISPPRLLWDPCHRVNFYQQARDQGMQPETEVVSVNPLYDAPLIRHQFGMDYGNNLELLRLRRLDGRPVMVERIYLRQTDFPGLAQQPLDGSITELFANKYQVQIDHESSHILVCGTQSEEAALLGIPEGTACLHIERKRYDANDRLVDYNLEYWRHDALELKVSSRK